MIIPVVVTAWFYTEPTGVRRPLRDAEQAKLATLEGYPVFAMKAGPGWYNPTPPIDKFLNNGKFKTIDGTLYRIV